MSTELEWVERVANGVTWRNDEDQDEVIAEMSLRRCDGLMSWLVVTKGASIEREHCAQMFLTELRPLLPEPRGFNVQGEIDTWERVPDRAPSIWNEIRAMPVFRERKLHPITWLKQTPLYKALEARRQELILRSLRRPIAAIWTVDAAREECQSQDRSKISVADLENLLAHIEDTAEGIRDLLMAAREDLGDLGAE